MKGLIDKQIHANELKLRFLMTNDCTRNCSFCLNDFQLKPKSNSEVKYLDSNIAKIAINQYAYFFKEKYPLQIYYSGGEPTLHPDLIELMKVAKSLDCRVTLITNGDFPDSLESGLKKFSDQIHFGTYEKSQKHAEKIKRMKGLIQCIYPHVDSSFIESLGIKEGAISKEQIVSEDEIDIDKENIPEETKEKTETKEKEPTDKEDN